VHEVTGFQVPPHDDREAGARLIQLLSDETLRARMGSKAASFVREQRSFDKAAGQFLAFVGGEHDVGQGIG
jgi:glycosyltransferase involved in cell wall biosynthesis